MTINADSTVQILAEEAHPLDRFDPQVCHLVSALPHCFQRMKFNKFGDLHPQDVGSEAKP